MPLIMPLLSTQRTRIEQGENVKIIVFGSFFTVAAVMEVIASKVLTSICKKNDARKENAQKTPQNDRGAVCQQIHLLNNL